MRIGVDCQCLQLPGIRQRGIGIYTEGLFRQLQQHRNHKYQAFVSNFFEVPPWLRTLGVPIHSISYLSPANSPDHIPVNQYLQQLALAAAELDVVHLTNPLEGENLVVPPDNLSDRYALVCTLFDLIPLLFPEHYLTHAGVRERYIERLKLYGRADLVLAISESARRDAIQHLHLSPAQVEVVGAAINPFFRKTNTSRATIEAIHRQLRLREKFVLYTGGFDFRKNLEGAIHGFSLLPPAVRQDLQLLIVCSLLKQEEQAVRDLARRYGVLESVMVANYVSQEWLIYLYNNCEVFLFPSLYEGFGLPVLEAMACGAPVLASNVSAIPEVVSDAGVLVEPNPAQIAEALEELLTSEQHRNQLRKEGLSRAKQFSWEKVASKTEAAYARVLPRSRSVASTFRGRKPRIAYSSVLPPTPSLVADYSAELLPFLARQFEIDVFSDRPGCPLPLESASVRFLGPSQRAESNIINIYQIANDPQHSLAYAAALRVPGITALHDINLHSLVRSLFCNGAASTTYVEELCFAHGGEGKAAWEMYQTGELSEEQLIDLLPMNRRILEASQGLIVHDENLHGQLLMNQLPGGGARVGCLSYGVGCPSRSLEHSAALRNKLCIDRSQLLLASAEFSLDTATTMRTLRIFRRVLESCQHAYLLLACRLALPGVAQTIDSARHDLGIAGRIHFLVAGSRAQWSRYLMGSDVVLCLNAQRSIGLLLQTLSCAVATVITNDCFSGTITNRAVMKVAENETPVAIANAVTSLLEDSRERQVMGKNAGEYIEQNHSCRQAAEDYRDFVERLRGEGLGSEVRLNNLAKSMMPASTTKSIDQMIHAAADNEGIGRELNAARPTLSGTRRIVFLHVPKSGGTSLHNLLGRYFKAREICPERLRFLDRIPDVQLAQYRLISGHYFFDQLARIPPPKVIITILREPRARLLSLFNYYRAHSWKLIEWFEKQELDSPRKAKELGLPRYLSDPDPSVRMYVDNAITRHLIGRAFIDRQGNFTVKPGDAVGIAISNLQKISFVILEHYTQSKLHLERALGIPMPDSLPKEKALETLTAMDGFEPVTPAAIDASTEPLIERCTFLDRQVYEWALQCLRLQPPEKSMDLIAPN